MITCQICGKNFEGKNFLGRHLVYHNIDYKKYYDEHIKNGNEDKCLICQKETKFKSITKGYNKTCCTVCRKIYTKTMDYTDIIKKTKNTCLEKYGVTNPLQVKKIQQKTIQTKIERYGEDYYKKQYEKGQETCKERYGVEHASQTNAHREKMSDVWKNRTQEEKIDIKVKSKITLKEKYGNENYNNRELAQQTMLEKYGGETTLTSPILKERVRNTCLEKYGSEWAGFNITHLREQAMQTYLKKTGYDHPTHNPNTMKNITQKIRYKQEQANRWLSLDQYKPFIQYRLLVGRETTKSIKKLPFSIKEIDRKQFHLDHKFSVFEGFRQNIDPKIIGSIHNLEILSASENIQKGIRCSITLEKLLEKYNLDTLQ